MSLLCTIVFVDNLENGVPIRKSFKFDKTKVTVEQLWNRCLKISKISEADITRYGIFVTPKVESGTVVRKGIWLTEKDKHLEDFELKKKEKIEFLQKRRYVNVALRTGVARQVACDVSVPISLLLPKVIENMPEAAKFVDPSLHVTRNNEVYALEMNSSFRAQSVKDDTVVQLVSTSSLGVLAKVSYKFYLERQQVTKQKVIRFDDSITGATALKVCLRKFNSYTVENQYANGIFICETEEYPNGIWIHPEAVLNHYNIQSMQSIEVKPKFRPVKVDLPPITEADGKTVDNRSTTMLIDDSLTVREIIPMIRAKVGSSGSYEYAELLQMKKGVAILDENKAIRQHGFIGPCTLILLHTTIHFEMQLFQDCGVELPSTVKEGATDFFRLCIVHPKIEGFVQKKSPSKLKSSFQKRYFAIKNEKIFYYKSKTEQEELNFIDITKVEAVEQKDVKGISAKERGASFQIKVPGRLFELLAPSPKVASDWVRSINLLKLLYSSEPAYFTGKLKIQISNDGKMMIPVADLASARANEEKKEGVEMAGYTVVEIKDKMISEDITIESVDIDDLDATAVKNLAPAYLYCANLLGFEEVDNLDETMVIENFSDGTLLLKVISKVFPDALGEEVLMEGSEALSSAKSLELMIGACRHMGLELTDAEIEILEMEILDPESAEGKKQKILKDNLIRRFTWDIVEAAIMEDAQEVSFDESPLLGEMLNAEIIGDGKDQKAIVREWANHVLADGDYKLRISNFGEDFQDCEKLIYLLHEISPDLVDLDILKNDDLSARAEYALMVALNLGVDVASASAIVSGNEVINFALVAQLCKRHLQTSGHEDVMKKRERQLVLNVFKQEKADIEDVSKAGKKVNEMIGILSQKRPDLVNQDDIIKGETRDGFIQNAKILVETLKKDGADVEGLTVDDIVGGRIVAAHRLAWQVAKRCISSETEMKSDTGSVELLAPGEEEEVLQDLKSEEFLVRWTNYQLKEGGFDITVDGLGREKLSVPLLKLLPALMKSVAPDVASDGILDDQPPKRKAQMIIEVCKKLQIPLVVEEADLLNDTPKIDYLVISSLFTVAPKLERHEDRLSRPERSIIASSVNDIVNEERIAGTAEDFITKNRDCVTLANLLHVARPDVVDVSKLNTTDNTKEALLNNAGVLKDGLDKIGVDVADLTEEGIVDGETIPIDQLSWKTVSNCMLGHVSIEDNPDLVEILEEGEEDEILENQSQMTTLHHWISYHSEMAIETIEEYGLDAFTISKVFQNVFGEDLGAEFVNNMEGAEDEHSLADTLEDGFSLVDMGIVLNKEELTKDEPSQKYLTLLGAAMFRKKPGIKKPEERLFSSERKVIAGFVNDILEKEEFSGAASDFIDRVKDSAVLSELVTKAQLSDDPSSVKDLSTIAKILKEAYHEDIASDSASLSNTKTNSVDEIMYKIVNNNLVRNVPEESKDGLVELLDDGVEDEEVEHLRSDDIICKWLAYHTNIDVNSGEIQNCSLPVLKQVIMNLYGEMNPQAVATLASASDDEALSQGILVALGELGVKTHVTSEVLTSKPPKVKINKLVAAQLFNFNPVLERDINRLTTSDRGAIAEFINESMNTTEVKPTSEGFISTAKECHVFAKMINSVKEGIVDESALGEDVESNVNLIKSGLRELTGDTHDDIDATEVAGGKTVAADLLTWSVVEACMLSEAKISENPALVELLEDGQEDEEVNMMAGDEKLDKWLMYHTELTQEEVHECDLEVLSKLAFALTPDSEVAFQLTTVNDEAQRAELIVQYLESEGVSNVPSANVVANNGRRLNRLISAKLFKQKPSLEVDPDRLTTEERHGVADCLNNLIGENVIEGSAKEFVDINNFGKRIAQAIASATPDIIGEDDIPDDPQENVIVLAEALSMLGAEVSDADLRHALEGKTASIDKIAYIAASSCMVKSVKMEDVPGIVELLQVGEDDSKIEELGPTDILNRWIFHHTGMEATSEEVADSSVSVIFKVASSIFPEFREQHVEAEMNDEQKAEALVAHVRDVGVKVADTGESLLRSARIRQLLVAQLFKGFPSLEKQESRLSTLERHAIASFVNDSFGQGTMAGSANGFLESKDGVALAKMLNSVKEGSVDETALASCSAEEGMALIKDAVTSLGGDGTKIDVEGIIEGKTIPIDTAIWEVVKVSYVGSTSVNSVPELVELVNDGEEVEEFELLSDEVVLDRWIAHHAHLVVDSEDVVKCPLSTLEIIIGNVCGESESYISMVQTSDKAEKVQLMRTALSEVGIEISISGEAIVEELPRVTRLVAATIMKKKHSLTLNHDRMTKEERTSVIEFINSVAGSEFVASAKEFIALDNVVAKIASLAKVEVDGSNLQEAFQKLETGKQAVFSNISLEKLAVGNTVEVCKFHSAIVENFYASDDEINSWEGLPDLCDGNHEKMGRKEILNTWIAMELELENVDEVKTKVLSFTDLDKLIGAVYEDKYSNDDTSVENCVQFLRQQEGIYVPDNVEHLLVGEEQTANRIVRFLAVQVLKKNPPEVQVNFRFAKEEQVMLAGISEILGLPETVSVSTAEMTIETFVDMLKGLYPEVVIPSDADEAGAMAIFAEKLQFEGEEAYEKCFKDRRHFDRLVWLAVSNKLLNRESIGEMVGILAEREVSLDASTGSVLNLHTLRAACDIIHPDLGAPEEGKQAEEVIRCFNEREMSTGGIDVEQLTNDATKEKAIFILFAEVYRTLKDEVETYVPEFLGDVDDPPEDPTLCKVLSFYAKDYRAAPGTYSLSGDRKSVVELARDSRALCTMINGSFPGTVDLRVLSAGVNKKSFMENTNLTIESGKAIGCTLSKVPVDDIITGKFESCVHLLYEIERKCLTNQIQPLYHPELLQLLVGAGGEFESKTPEETIIEFVDFFTLKMAGTKHKMADYADSLRNGQVLNYLFKEVHNDKYTFSKEEPWNNISTVLPEIGQPPLSVDELKTASQDVFLLLLASIVTNSLGGDVFKKSRNRRIARMKQIAQRKSSSATDAESRKAAQQAAQRLKAEEDKARKAEALADLDSYQKLLEDMASDTREQRAYKVWLNCLGIENVRNIFGDLESGVLLLQLIDKIEPGKVNWREKVKKKPSNVWQKIDNSNYALSVARNDLGIPLRGIEGKDVVDGSQMYILTLLWQLWRYNIISFLKLSIKSKESISDEFILDWANKKADSEAKGIFLPTFDDPSVSNSHFLIELIDSVFPGAVNKRFVLPGDNDEEKSRNAKYVISVARRLGCEVFLLWEDIVEARKKMIFQFIAAVIVKSGEME